jgi:hypothetical protein
MMFLEDAHRNRGVLRQVGAVYEFRHLELQRHLASRSAAGREEGLEPSSTQPPPNPLPVPERSSPRYSPRASRRGSAIVRWPATSADIRQPADRTSAASRVRANPFSGRR